MAYFIQGPCINCSRCKDVCPVGAPHSTGLRFEIDPEKCVGCKQCMKVACPSLAFDPEQKKAYVADTANCNRCGLCMQQCKFGAIAPAGN